MVIDSYFSYSFRSSLKSQLTYYSFRGLRVYSNYHKTFRLRPHEYFEKNIRLKKNFFAHGTSLNYRYYSYSSPLLSSYLPYGPGNQITEGPANTDKSNYNLPEDKWKSLCVKFYENAERDRFKISTDNSGKSGIYLWHNRLNGKVYVGQSLNLGDPKKGRLIRYYHKSYLMSKTRGNSILRSSLIKNRHANFSVAILEYCSQDLLELREQYWLDFLEPEYNILKFSKSSRGYKHTPESIKKMKGPRPHYKPSPEHLAKIGELSRNRVYGQEFRDNISKREGYTVYVYDSAGQLINIYSSIVRLKKYYGLTMHHKTLYKRISRGLLFDNYRFSFTPLDTSNSSIFNTSNCTVKSLVLNKESENKARKIQLTYLDKGKEILKIFPSINSASLYIKKIDGSVDKATIRKYINSDKLYKNKWKIFEIE